MDIVIRATPYFVLPLTRKHIDTLYILSETHYDGVCKQASQQGGFLYGWHNSLAYVEDYGNSEEPFTVNASATEVQTVMKLLESKRMCFHSGLIDDDAYKLCTALDMDLHRAFSLFNSKYHEWQAVSPGVKPESLVDP